MLKVAYKQKVSDEVKELAAQFIANHHKKLTSQHKTKTKHHEKERRNFR